MIHGQNGSKKHESMSSKSSIPFLNSRYGIIVEKLSLESRTSEETEIDCLNPYAHSKYTGESLFRQYWKEYKVDSVVFRYFNVFGERSPIKGQYAPVVGIFLNQLKNKTDLTIVGDGLKKRDFIYVGDIVTANISAMDYVGNLESNTINIGSGNNITIKEKTKVESIIPLNGLFKVKTLQGEELMCKYVLLAIGRRGSPRKLDVPGEMTEKVAYRLLEPELVNHKNIIVVGGGDSAVEAALSLAKANKVSFSSMVENSLRQTMQLPTKESTDDV